MNCLSTCFALALGLTLISAEAPAAAQFTCAPEARAELCSPSGLWLIFDQSFVRLDQAGRSHPLLLEFLNDEEMLTLALAVGEESRSSPSIAALRARLPAGAQLAWKLATAEITPSAAALGARGLSDTASQVALLNMLTTLNREPALVAALNWSIHQTPTRQATLSWLLLAGDAEAIAFALNDVVQCHRDESQYCGRELPYSPIFNVLQLQAVWHQLSVTERREVLWRTSAEGVEDFLRRELQQHDQSRQLLDLWSEVAAADGRVDTIIATLLLERLLDPVERESSRWQMPITDDRDGSRFGKHPFDTAEIEAWNYLVATSSIAPEFWTPFAASPNPWLKTLGVAALLAADMQVEAEGAWAGLFTNNGAPPILLLELLREVDTAAADQAFRRAFSAVPTSIQSACVMAKTIDSERVIRMAPEFLRWAQTAFASVNYANLPDLDNVLPEEGKPLTAEPFRSVNCVLSELPKAHAKTNSDRLLLGRWLGSQKPEIYQLIGAIIEAESGDLRALDQWLRRENTKDIPARERLRTEMQRGLERLRGRM